jgi:ADP-heptose:LPS heptosyltransferase
MLVHRTDCRHYRGEKPCKYKRLCAECPFASPVGTRILLLKFGAIGDALRTTPILRALPKRWPDPHVTWLTDAISEPLLQGIEQIDRLWIYDLTSSLRVAHEQFDVMLNFDKVPAALCLAEASSAREKYGFRISPEGNLTIFNRESEYALLLGLSDPVKFHQNTKTYPEIISEMIGIPYSGEEYLLHLTAEEEQWAGSHFAEWGIPPDAVVVGLNTGCGPVFTSKKWSENSFAQLGAALLREYPQVRLVLLGGPAERERNQRLRARLGTAVVDTGADNPIRRFGAMVGRCAVVVTGDTMAMHVAIALRRRVVALFGPTTHREIDLYGRGEVIVAPSAGFPCLPCYSRECRLEVPCIDAISVEDVFAAVRRQLEQLPGH